MNKLSTRHKHRKNKINKHEKTCAKTYFTCVICCVLLCVCVYCTPDMLTLLSKSQETQMTHFFEAYLSLKILIGCPFLFVVVVRFRRLVCNNFVESKLVFIKSKNQKR